MIFEERKAANFESILFEIAGCIFYEHLAVNVQESEMAGFFCGPFVNHRF